MSFYVLLCNFCCGMDYHIALLCFEYAIGTGAQLVGYTFDFCRFLLCSQRILHILLIYILWNKGTKRNFMNCFSIILCYFCFFINCTKLFNVLLFILLLCGSWYTLSHSQKWRIISAKQGQGQTTCPWHYAVDWIRLNPATLRLPGKNCFTVYLSPKEYYDDTVMVSVFVYYGSHNDLPLTDHGQPCCGNPLFWGENLWFCCL